MGVHRASWVAVIVCCALGAAAALAGEPEAVKKAEGPKLNLDDVTVYITKSSKKYHCPWCGMLHGKAMAVKLSEAVKNDYTPCSACQPKGGRWASMTDGKSLKGWEAVKEEMFVAGGPVKCEKGEIILTEGAELTAVRWTGEFPRNNYELLFEARRVDGFDYFAAPTFPVGKDYVSLITGGWGDTVVGLSCIDDQLAADNETCKVMGLKNKQWYQFHIKVAEPKIEVWIDKDQVIDFNRKGRRLSVFNMEPLRPLGIASWCTTGAVRNVRVRAVKPAEK